MIAEDGAMTGVERVCGGVDGIMTGGRVDFD